MMVNLLRVYYERAGNDKIISQIFGDSEICDQNGDRVSKSDKSCHIGSVKLKSFFS